MSPTNLSSTTSTSSSFVVGPSADKDSTSAKFVDRRKGGDTNAHTERRQFGSSHVGLSDDGRELALAIDEFKVQHHRRYLTCDEMLQVLTSLGYSK